MSSSRSFLNLLLDIVRAIIRAAGSQSSTPTATRPKTPSQRPRAGVDTALSPGQAGTTATLEVDPPAKGTLTISYEPRRDGIPDAGEVIWTWVPYQEGDGRGKDRPVLVIARHEANRVYAVRLTSKAHDGDRDYLSIGSGDWDPQHRPSWVDIEQLYSVHAQGMRREAAVIDRTRFVTIAQALKRRYGWEIR